MTNYLLAFAFDGLSHCCNHFTRRKTMEHTSTTKKSAQKPSCPCMDMNERYAKGFNDEDLIVEEDEIDISEEAPHKKKNS